ncbi:helix-turn-helix transcriptional regulator [Micromonospora radicis]|uniref:LuxR family transcriptional regulator n=1 Tax=Micromonospora radicis TaxID=1894971 RepID=A0A418MP01_9ACTN|nr:AAA family ATPase [Micromonospora radicis]RIV33200.1 LuxR family transcriptional regulator [Micromonospora radicis]
MEAAWHHRLSIGVVKFHRFSNFHLAKAVMALDPQNAADPADDHQPAADADTLVGRDCELSIIDGVLGRAGRGDAALLFVGDPGVGKSALLAAAAARAVRNRMRVLRCVGSVTETHLPYAGLHQALHPILGLADRLRPAQRAALGAAFGLTDDAVQSQFRVGLATLELITVYAAEAPVLMTVDDAHWLDRSTCDVLAFVARRLAHDPVALIAAGRDRDLADNPLTSIGIPLVRLGPLPEPDAVALVRQRVGNLPGDALRQLLTLAAGNPLALVELPKARHQRAADPAPHTVLPLTAHLERTFGDQVGDLPPATQAVLVAASLNDSGSVAESIAAAARVTGMDIGFIDLAPAEACGMVTVVDGRLSFRHPLVQSAIRQAQPAARRREFHAALAEVVAADPVRRIWHRADASEGTDDAMADELERLATRLLQRASPASGAAALERAARLSSDAAVRGRRLIAATHVRTASGAYEDASRLANESVGLLSDASIRSYLGLYRQLTEGDWLGTEVIATVTTASRRFQSAGATEAAMVALMVAATAAWWADASVDTCRPAVRAARSLPVPADDSGLILLLTMLAPGEQDAELLRTVRKQAGDDAGMTHELVRTSAVFSVLGALPEAFRRETDTMDLLRADGHLALLAQVLAGRAWNAQLLGRSGAAASAAAECKALVPGSGPVRTFQVARLAEAMLAARRGEVAEAESIAAEVEAVLLRAAAHPMLAMVQLVRGTAALAAGRFDAAYDHLIRIFDPSDIAHHSRMTPHAMVELTESAVLARRLDRVRELHQEWVAQADRSGSPHLVVNAAVTTALLATDPRAAYLVALGEITNEWPIHRAKALLAYGRWLRRGRRVTESRAALRNAQDLFDALDMPPWRDQAARELRASGEQSPRRPRVTSGRLTPQERQIAMLAAEGLTNAEIAEKLFVSVQTVRTHMYRIFPKLGITSRVDLATAISGDDYST